MPTTTTDADPFTLVHQAIWSALTGYAPWADLVRPGNRVRFDEGKTTVPKTEMPLQAGDCPEVRLEQGLFAADLNFCDGQAVEGTLHFPLRIQTADYDVVKLNLVKWQTIRALVAAGHALGMPELIQRVEVRDGKDDAAAYSKEAWKARRWISVCRIVVRLAIDNDDCLAGTYPIA
jgi:hypothetical protein